MRTLSTADLEAIRDIVLDGSLTDLHPLSGDVAAQMSEQDTTTLRQLHLEATAVNSRLRRFLNSLAYKSALGANDDS